MGSLVEGRERADARRRTRSAVPAPSQITWKAMMEAERDDAPSDIARRRRRGGLAGCGPGEDGEAHEVVPAGVTGPIEATCMRSTPR